MPRDFWQTFKKALTVGKTNKTLTIPSFSEKCNFDVGSLKVSSGIVSADLLLGDSISLVQSCHLEFWIKPEASFTGVLNQFLKLSAANIAHIPIANDYIAFAIDDNCNLYVQIKHPSPSFDEEYLITKLPRYEWSHICFLFNTYDYLGGDEPFQFSIYIDGIFIKSEDLTGLITPDHCNLYLRNNISYNIAELRYFNSDTLLRTSDYINYFFNKRINVNPSISTDLIFYSRFNSAGISGNVITHDYSLHGPSTTSLTEAYKLDEDNFPSLVFGASFIVLEYPILTTSNKLSLKYPIKKSTIDCNFCLCVRWIDENGVVQRRKFWTVGEDINPDPAIYAGETLDSSPVLEVWNIDGNKTVDLASNLVINTSIVSKAQSSKDHTITELETLVEKSTLWAAFPWDNTQAFNEANPF